MQYIAGKAPMIAKQLNYPGRDRPGSQTDQVGAAVAVVLSIYSFVRSFVRRRRRHLSSSLSSFVVVVVVAVAAVTVDDGVLCCRCMPLSLSPNVQDN